MNNILRKNICPSKSINVHYKFNLIEVNNVVLTVSYSRSDARYSHNRSFVHITKSDRTILLTIKQKAASKQQRQRHEAFISSPRKSPRQGVQQIAPFQS